LFETVQESEDSPIHVAGRKARFGIREPTGRTPWKKSLAAPVRQVCARLGENGQGVLKSAGAAAAAGSIN
jgi:hypothetical protein